MTRCVSFGVPNITEISEISEIVNQVLSGRKD